VFCRQAARDYRSAYRVKEGQAVPLLSGSSANFIKGSYLTTDMAQGPFEGLSVFLNDARQRLDEAFKHIWQEPVAHTQLTENDQPTVQEVVTGPDLTMASFKRSSMSMLFPDVQETVAVDDPYDLPQLQHHLDKALELLAAADHLSSTREDGSPLDTVDRVLLRKAALESCRLYVREAKALRRTHGKQQKQHGRRVSIQHKQAAGGFVGFALGLAAIKAFGMLARRIVRTQHVGHRHATRAPLPCLVAA
jgi:hypothetical protein